MYSETTPLSKVLGKREATKFRTARGITTVGDLLGYWPRRYQSPESNLGAATVGSYIVAVAEVKSATTRTMKARRGRMLQAVITDGSKDLEITFFSAHGHEGKLLPGTRALFAGKVSSFNNRLQLAHPGYSLLSDFDRGERRDLIPIYRAVGNLHTWTVTECVRMVLDLLDETPEAIPEPILDRRDLMDRTAALRGIHTPASTSEVDAARRRMSYEEAFVLQVALAQRRARQAQESTKARVPRPGGLLDAFDERLPFTLTDGQREIGETLATEMARDAPDAPAPPGRGRLGQDRRRAAGHAGGRRRRRVRRRCSPRPRCSPRSTTGPSPRCSATWPRAACSAGPTRHEGHAAHRQHADGVAAQGDARHRLATPASSSAPTPSSRST